jgi:hypothetical protein
MPDERMSIPKHLVSHFCKFLHSVVSVVKVIETRTCSITETWVIILLCTNVYIVYNVYKCISTMPLYYW